MTSADTRFAGSIPETYEEHLGALLFEPYALDLAARVRDVSGVVLETAAGTGRVTRALTQALLPGVRVVATDLNDAMLEVARARTKAPSVTFQQADAMKLPFEDGAFSAVVCQFGAMFFPDRAAGFREAKRVLRDKGAFLFNVWGKLADNEVSRIAFEAVRAMFPSNPPSFFERLPFGYHDAERIRRDVTEAGFRDIRIDHVDAVTRGTARSIAIGMVRGTPMFSEIEERAPRRVEEAVESVAAELTRRFGKDPIENRMRALVVTAR